MACVVGVRSDACDRVIAGMARAAVHEGLRVMAHSLAATVCRGCFGGLVVEAVREFLGEVAPGVCQDPAASVQGSGSEVKP